MVLRILAVTLYLESKVVHLNQSFNSPNRLDLVITITDELKRQSVVKNENGVYNYRKISIYLLQDCHPLY